MTGKTASLIALVATAVMVAGERVVVQAGEPLPEPIKPRDRAEMLASKVAAESTDAPQALESTLAPAAPELSNAEARAPITPAASEPKSRPKKK